jgi:hypothetical protein
MIINEANITDVERVCRNIMEIVSKYNPELTKADIYLTKTQKNNYKLCDNNDNLILLISKYLLRDDVIQTLGIKLK